MFGAASAKYLARSGARIAAIGPCEPKTKQIANTQQTFGAYYDEARITWRLGWDGIWGAMDSRSLHRFRDIESDSGIPFFHECGSLILLAGSISSRTDAIYQHCQEQSIIVQRLPASTLKTTFPYLNAPSLLGGVEGIFEPAMAGYLNPRRLVSAQLHLFEDAGGTLIRGSVTKVSKNNVSGLWRVVFVEKNRTKDIYARSLLLATGAFTNHNNILNPETKLALYAFGEPNILYEVTQKTAEGLRSLPPVAIVDPEDTGINNMSVYLLPPIRYPDSKWYLRIGPGMQPFIHALDTHKEMRQWYIQQKITDPQKQFLVQTLKKLLPDVEPVSIKQATCIIQKTPTRYPYIGPLADDDTLHVVVGGNGHGARGSDEIGRLVANSLLNETWDFPFDRSIFSPILAHSFSNHSTACGFLKPPFGLC